MADLEKYLTQTHSDYLANATLWAFLNDAYYGKGGFADGAYIKKYAKEASTKHTDRKSEAYYINYCQPIIDTYNGHLFKQPITRTSEQEDLTRFFNKTSAAGDVSLTELMKQASQVAMIKGTSYIVVDKPATPTETVQDEIDTGAYPYAYVLDPSNMLDWAVDEYDEFIWVKIQESFLTNNKEPFEAHITGNQYRVWYRDRWELYDVDGALIGKGDHDLMVVPIVKVINRKVIGSIIGVSEIDAISKINKRLYNLCSEIDELLRAQTFAILTYPAIDTKSLDDVELGTDRILTYDPASSHKPEFIAPPATATQAYETRIEKLVEEIYRLAKLKFTGGVMSSGIAYAFDFEKTNQVLCNKAQKLLKAEEAVLQLVAKWQDIDYDAMIQYPTDYSLKEINDEIQAAMDVLTLGLGDRFNKEYKKSLSKKILTNLPPEKQAEVEIEIEQFEELREPDIEAEE